MTTRLSSRLSKPCWAWITSPLGTKSESCLGSVDVDHATGVPNATAGHPDPGTRTSLGANRSGKVGATATFIRKSDRVHTSLTQGQPDTVRRGSGGTQSGVREVPESHKLGRSAGVFPIANSENRRGGPKAIRDRQEVSGELRTATDVCGDTAEEPTPMTLAALQGP